MKNASEMVYRILPTAAFLQFFFCVVLAVAVPKATTLSLGILVFGSFCALVLFRTDRLIRRDVLTGEWAALLVLPLVVSFSSFWSANPDTAYRAGLQLAFVFLGFSIISSGTTHLPEPVLRACKSGFAAGVIFAVTLSAVDLISNQSITRWAFSTWPSLPEAQTPHVYFHDGQALAVSIATANRRATVLVCLLPAYIFSLRNIRTAPRTLWWAAPGLMGYAALLASTYSLTAQMAAALAMVAFISAVFMPRFAPKMLITAWITIWLLVIPIVLLLANSEWAKATWLPSSAAERVQIWGGVAQEVLTKPVFGWGVGVETYISVGPESSMQPSAVRLPVHHPHNGFLQVWHELGSFGALLVGAMGIWVLHQFSRLPVTVRPYAYGLFAAGAAISATGYGIWQHWHLSAFALGAAFLRIESQLAEFEKLEGEQKAERVSPAEPDDRLTTERWVPAEQNSNSM